MIRLVIQSNIHDVNYIITVYSLTKVTINI